MRVYVSGPIKGYEDGNRWAFAEAATALIVLGHRPVNPHKVEAICPGDCTPIDEDNPHAYSCYMRGDIAALTECDAILLLDGWTFSRGAKDELNVALSCEMPVYRLHDGALLNIGGGA